MSTKNPASGGTTTKPKRSKGKPDLAPLAVYYASEEGMRGGLNQWIRLQLQLTSADAVFEKRVARLNELHAKAHAEKRERVAVLETSIALYCRTNRHTLFPDLKKKSVEYENATIGYRWDPFGVDLVLEKDTPARAALRLDSAAAAAAEERAKPEAKDVPDHEWLADFVVWTPSLDKKRLLKMQDQLTPERIGILESLGIVFSREEKFYIDPKADAAERVSTVSEPEAHAEAA